MMKILDWVAETIQLVRAFTPFRLPAALGLYNLFHIKSTAPRLLFRQQAYYLCVLDLDFDEHGNSTRVELLRMQRDAGPSIFSQRSLESDRAEIENAVASLPTRPHGGIRIYLVQDLSPSLLRDDVHGEAADAIRHSSGMSGIRGYHGLAVQWSAPKPRFCFESASFLLGFGTSTSIVPGMMRNTKRAHTLEQSDGGLILWISSETHVSWGFSGMRQITDLDDEAATMVRISMKNFAFQFEQLQDHYEPLLWEVKTCNRRKQVLLLWVNHAQLFETLNQFESVRYMFQSLRELRVGSRRSKLLPQLLDEFATDANTFKELEVIAGDFISALESLLGTIKAGFKNETGAAQEFNAIAADIRGLSSDLRRKAGEMPRLLDHHLKFLEVRRNMQESNNLWMLSVLASIFLPLSLASGILSMQTRLKDLHYLLYDFLGVVVLLLTLVGLVLLLVKASMMASERVATRGSRWSLFGKRAAKLGFTMAILSVWTVVLASFVVGMAENVRLGGFILGYGIAGLVGIVAAMMAAVFCVVI